MRTVDVMPGLACAAMLTDESRRVRTIEEWDIRVSHGPGWATDTILLPCARRHQVHPSQTPTGEGKAFCCLSVQGEPMISHHILPRAPAGQEWNGERHGHGSDWNTWASFERRAKEFSFSSARGFHLHVAGGRADSEFACQTGGSCGR